MIAAGFGSRLQGAPEVRDHKGGDVRTGAQLDGSVVESFERGIEISEQTILMLNLVAVCVVASL